MAHDLARYGGALVSRKRWQELGLHSRVLAGPDLTTVFHGFHTPTDHPASVNAMASVLQNKVLPGSVLSHTTAALLWDIPIPAQLERGIGLLRPRSSRGDPEPGPIPALRAGESLRIGAQLPVLHCRVPQGTCSTISRGAVVHRWDPGPTGRAENLLLSSPCEVLRELATMLPVWDVVAAIDGVVGPKSLCPGVTLQDVAAHVELMRGRRGTARLRQALALARDDSWSPGETLIRLLVVGAGLPEPTLNLPQREPVSGQLRYLDLAWEQFMFVLEYDGDGHRMTKEQWRDDEARRDELSSLGWTISRANGDDLWHPLRILLRLQRSLAERGAPAPSPERIRRFVAALPDREVSVRIARRQPRA